MLINHGIPRGRGDRTGNRLQYYKFQHEFKKSSGSAARHVKFDFNLESIAKCKKNNKKSSRDPCKLRRIVRHYLQMAAILRDLDASDFGGSSKSVKIFFFFFNELRRFGTGFDVSASRNGSRENLQRRPRPAANDNGDGMIFRGNFSLRKRGRVSSTYELLKLNV